MIACAAALMLAMIVAAGATDFFSAIEDLPLPAGFSETGQESVVFETPGGRIVTAVARGRGEIAGVRDFYRETLPPLGWRALDGDRYRRADEELSLDFARDGGLVTVRVRLVPAESGN